MPEAKRDPLAELYWLGETCENMFLRYKAAMMDRSMEEYRAFKDDAPLYETVLGLFYAAESKDELDSYMDKTPAELAEIVAQKYKGGNGQ